MLNIVQILESDRAGYELFTLISSPQHDRGGLVSYLGAVPEQPLSPSS